MKNSPLVSIILTTYNRRNLLPYAIQSVLDQTYTNYEIIVINDYGEDVWDIVESFNTNKIIYIANIKNHGPSFSRNSALKIANGEIICYLDDDDLYLPKHLEVITSSFQNQAVEFVYVNSYEIDEKLINSRRIEVTRRVRSKSTASNLMVENFIPINTWGHRKYLMNKIGYFDESLHCFEDWDVLLRINKIVDLIHIDKVTVEVRHDIVHKDNILTRENKTNKYYEKIYSSHLVKDYAILKQRQKVLYYMTKVSNNTSSILKTYLLWKYKLKYILILIQEKGFN